MSHKAEEVEEIFQRAKEQGYSSREIKEILRKAREWANSPEGISAMREVRKKFDDYVAIRKREREGRPSIDIYKPFMADI